MAFEKAIDIFSEAVEDLLLLEDLKFGDVRSQKVEDVFFKI